MDFESSWLGDACWVLYDTDIISILLLQSLSQNACFDNTSCLCYYNIDADSVNFLPNFQFVILSLFKKIKININLKLLLAIVLTFRPYAWALDRHFQHGFLWKSLFFNFSDSLSILYVFFFSSPPCVKFFGRIINFLYFLL